MRKAKEGKSDDDAFFKETNELFAIIPNTNSLFEYITGKIR
jgi:hypothetical protein